MKNLARNEFTVLLRYFVSIGYTQKACYEMLQLELFSEAQAKVLENMGISYESFTHLVHFVGMFRYGSQEIVIHRRKSS